MEQAISLEELMAQRGSDVHTAFTVYQTLEGQWVVTPEIGELNLTPERQATFDDIIGGSSAIVASCTAQQAAMTTLTIMEQRAAQQMQAMQQQQAASKVASLIDPSKLRNPRA